MTAPTDLVWTREEAARLLKCGLTKVSALVGTGELPSIKIGGQRLIRDTDLREFVANQPVVPGQGAA